jgi:hypothetical protein
VHAKPAGTLTQFGLLVVNATTIGDGAGEGATPLTLATAIATDCVCGET